MPDSSSLLSACPLISSLPPLSQCSLSLVFCPVSFFLVFFFLLLYFSFLSPLSVLFLFLLPSTPLLISQTFSSSLLSYYYSSSSLLFHRFRLFVLFLTLPNRPFHPSTSFTSIPISYTPAFSPVSPSYFFYFFPFLLLTLTPFFLIFPYFFLLLFFISFLTHDLAGIYFKSVRGASTFMVSTAPDPLDLHESIPSLYSELKVTTS